jgi:DNA-directed RNA polymerase subunit N (RpoN/RPB10)
MTCGKTLADKYDYYVSQVALLEQTAKSKDASKAGPLATKDEEAKAEEAHATRHFDPIRTGPILDAMGLTRYCCRRHMLTTVDMMEVI